jgi:hypothetical protein
MSGHSLFGYSTAGKPVAGQENVQFAPPAEDSGWWIARRKIQDRSLSLMAYSYLAPDGRESYLRDGRWLRHREFLRTESAMINLPTYADSVRTGFTMLMTVYSEGDLARAHGLIRVAGKALFVGQLDATETRDAHVGIVDLLEQEGELQSGRPWPAMSRRRRTSTPPQRLPSCTRTRSATDTGTGVGRSAPGRRSPCLKDPASLPVLPGKGRCSMLQASSTPWCYDT